ncbi:MAG: tRNA (adenosine(37)-N6)-threonylcarbamoyltransferase complex transferase subunit TsaD [Bacteroidaceae bacterium]|nr:tRNA (adenosine(37)-N6)-threonylcarbamoyltransferase complex transferase subunit TsaD [Bacteroidaceae bacterium]
MENKPIAILGIESSCDDTSAAVIRDGYLLSNVTASQAVHEAYGGVVPELASRAHELNIVPVVDQALKRAGVTKEELSAIAFTRGPGLMGSLLVGVSFAKGFAASLGIPMIDVNHLQGHVLANFIKEEPSPSDATHGKVASPISAPEGATPNEVPSPRSTLSSDGSPASPPFPFLCLLVSGGNSQIVLVKAYNDMEIIGQTIDDAAGECIDKCSKVMGLGYPGGPVIDRLARQGNPEAYAFSKPSIPGYDYSFSGLKTSFLYNLRDWLKEDPDFIEHHKEDLAASLEKTVVDILMNKLRRAAQALKIKHVALAGGVSANTGLREAFRDHARRYGWTIYIPKFSYTTDNAAMIAITGYFKYGDKDFCPMEAPAYSRVAL